MPVLPDINIVRNVVDREFGPEGLRAEDRNAVILLGSTAMYMATGSERYIDHNDRMFGLARKFGIGTEVMSSYIGMHDLVEGLFSDDEREQTSTRDFITEYGNGLDTDSKRLFLASTGYAIGGHYLEAEIAESWREPTLQAVDMLSEVDEDDRTLIKQAITKELPKYTDIAHLERLLKNTRLVDLDIELLSSIIDRHDVESVLCKSIELIDNLDKPNRPLGNPASTWRDAIEALTCWGPICDLYGYTGVGAELRSKAYEFFYEDQGEVSEKAERQHELSDKYLPLASEVATYALQESYRGIGQLPVSSRIKTVGSIEQKLVEAPEYAGADMVADGIGVRVIVPDGEFFSIVVTPFADRTIEMLTRLSQDQFGDNISEFSVELWHPTGTENAREDRVENGGKDAYHAYHMTFMMHVNGEHVPFEIQVFGTSQDVEYIWGPQSHPVYKLQKYGEIRTKRKQRLEQDLLNQHLQSFRARAEYLMDNPSNPSLNPNSWFDILRLLPDLETPLHDVYGVNDAGVMMPKILIGTPAAEVAEGDERGVILPPSQMSPIQFKFLIDLLDPSLSTDRDIMKALDTVIERQGSFTRRDGETNDVEGHILPATAYAAIVATISGQRWEAEKPIDLKKIIIAALLHDTLEDTYGESQAERAVGIGILNQEFGWEATHTVMALTLPIKPLEETEEDKQLRRSLYIQQVQEDEKAVQIKPADRLQNHILDVVRLMRQEIEFDDARLGWVERYRAKTDDHMGGLFDEIPHGYYREARRVLWNMLTESLQYRREQLDNIDTENYPATG